MAHRAGGEEVAFDIEDLVRADGGRSVGANGRVHRVGVDVGDNGVGSGLAQPLDEAHSHLAHALHRNGLAAQLI